MSNQPSAASGPGVQGPQISMRAIWRPHLLVFFATLLLAILPLRGLITTAIFMWWSSTYRATDFIMEEARPNDGYPYFAGHFDGSTEPSNLEAAMVGSTMVVAGVPNETFAAGKRVPVWHSDTAPTIGVFGWGVNNIPVASMPSRPGLLSFLLYLVWFWITWVIGLRATAWVANRWSVTASRVATFGSPTGGRG